MGSTLFNTTPQNTYPSLIKIGDNLPLSGTLKVLSDGNGNDSVLALSTASLQIGGATGATWDNTNKRLGIGTTAPIGLLHLYKSAAATRLAIDGDAGQSRLISYRTGAVQRFGLYVNNTAESGSNVGSDFAVRAYSDAGTLLSTPLFIERSTGNVGIGTTAPSQLLTVQKNSASVYSATTPTFNTIEHIKNATSGTGTNSILNFTSEPNGEWYIGCVNKANFADFVFTSRDAAYGERMRITSAGNVGIGTTAPTSMLHIAKDGVQDANATFSQLRISGTSDLTKVINLGYDSASEFGFLQVADISNAFQNMEYGAANHIFKIGSTERVRITNDGITFNGDTAAANALDDYEEGTFTPTNAGDATGVVSSPTGRYTKIGNVVHFRMIVGISTSFTGNAIGGLPYTIAGGGSSSLYGGMIAYNDSDSDLSATPNATTTNIIIYSGSDTNAATSPTSTMGILRISGTYFV